MKKVFAFVSLCFMAQSYAFSQVSPSIGLIKNFPLCLNVGLTYNEWANVPAYLTENPARNEGFDISLTHPFDTKKVQFIAGLGLSVVDFHTNADIWQFDSTGLLSKDGLVPTSSYKNNKIALTYFELPLELKYEPTGFRSNGFYIAAGFKPGYCVDAHTKIVTDIATEKYKSFDDIARWRYSATFKIGYGHLSLYGMYSLKPTFNSASDASYFTPYSVGVVYGTLD